MTRNEYSKIFKDKKRLNIFVPTVSVSIDLFSYLIKLLDMIDAYFHPLLDGVSKQDIVEYFTDQKFEGMDFGDFLRFRKYLATEEDFINFYKAYFMNCGLTAQDRIEGMFIEITKGLSEDHERIQAIFKKLVNFIHSIEGERKKNIKIPPQLVPFNFRFCYFSRRLNKISILRPIK